MPNKKSQIKIYFILNTFGLTGGVKVIFEHANLLAHKGYNIRLVHLLYIKNGFPGLVIATVKKIKYLFEKNSRPKWFSLDDRIETSHVMRLSSLRLSDTDLIVATANETADFVNELKHDIRRKYYYIQDYEAWSRDLELVDKTYKYPLRQIVVSETIRAVVEQKSGKPILGVVSGGVDLEKFGCCNKKRNDSPKILMLYHPLPKKGFAVGLSAMEEVKKALPNVRLVVFGTYLSPESGLIDEYYLKPSATELARLYCESDIYFYPAVEEGFGLTLLEAAAAKCAIASTRVGWTQEHGIDGKNIIFLPKNDPQKMAAIIIDLVNDKQKQFLLGEAAAKIAEEFSWMKCNDELEKLLIKI